MGLPSRVGRVEAQVGCVGALESFFKLAFRCHFFRFWSDFGRFLEAKMVPKIDFWEVFFDAFMEHDFGIDFHRFFVFFSSSNLDFCAHSQCFVRIFIKSMFLENCRKSFILEPFSEAKSTKI